MPADAPLDRRSLLKLAACTVALAACGRQPTSVSDAAAPVGPAPTTPPAAPPPPPPPPAPPAVPPVARYAPLPGEVLPELKQVASDFVQALTTRQPGMAPEDVVVAALAYVSPRLDADRTAAVAAPLHEAGVSSGEIVYPQYGGLAPDGTGAQRASIMVVVRQRLLSPGGQLTAVTRTCDVRLSRTGARGGWQVTDLLSVGGEPVDRPAGLAPEAVAVLDDPRIELPDSARWDVHAGRVGTPLLSVMSEAAARAPIGVAVLQTGHPVHVFDTRNTSAHTVGRAVDVWRVGDVAVVGQAVVGSPMRAVLDGAFADRRVTQTGSPDGTDLDGPAGRRSFTNTVHSDHLHIAV
jgi:hypothetical protein